ncbi:hypothetical protein [Staphylococcus equorum]|uniref:hypothetical protein n=1 Tax=Staphylococcus equorum TaxID=246432 RepID=UPI003CE7C9CA
MIENILMAMLLVAYMVIFDTVGDKLEKSTRVLIHILVMGTLAARTIGTLTQIIG